MDPRRELYWDLYDFSQGHGLEVGPLHRPMVGRSEGDVSYVDVVDRERLLAHYAGDPNVPPDAIPEIDYFLIDRNGATSSLADAVKAGAPYDWVMASHVIEHVPNVIGWLDDLAEVVADNGSLVLAVPDRRYCFDVHRPPTTVGQMLAAHYSDDRVPAVGSVYDYFRSSVDYTLEELWGDRIPTLDRRIHTINQALDKVGATMAGEYVDCHVWLFTPASFVRQMQELRVLGKSSWIVERLEPTPSGDLEFRAVLRRLSRGSELAGDQPREVQPEGDLPDWLSQGVAAAARIGELELANQRLGARVERLQRRSERHQSQLRSKTRRLKKLRRALARADADARARRSRHATPKWRGTRSIARAVRRVLSPAR